MFSLGIIVENKRIKCAVKKQESVVVLRESHGESRKGCLIDAEKAMNKVNREPQGGTATKAKQEESDQGYQIRQEGQRGHRDSRVSQKEVI